MDKELVQQIIASGSAMLSQLGKTLGSTGAHVYGVIVKQQFVMGLSTLIMTLLLVISCLISSYFLIKIDRKYVDDYNRGVLSVGGLLVAWFLLVIVFVFLNDALQHLINPEFFAIQFILDSVSKK